MACAPYLSLVPRSSGGASSSGKGSLWGGASSSGGSVGTEELQYGEVVHVSRLVQMQHSDVVFSFHNVAESTSLLFRAGAFDVPSVGTKRK